MKKILIYTFLFFFLIKFNLADGLFNRFSKIFHPGDSLKYEFQWKWLFFIPSITAGTLEIKYLGEEKFKDRFLKNKISVLHFSAVARSSGTLPKIIGIKIIDKFEIYVKKYTFTTILLIQNIHEGKRNRYIIERYFPKTQRLLYRKYKIVDRKYYVAQKCLYLEHFPRNIHDPVSVFFMLPIIDKSTKEKLKLPIFFNGKYRIFNISFEMDGFKKNIFNSKEKTWKVTAKNVFGGIKKGYGKLTLYFIKNPIMIPIYLEAKIKHGKVKGYLIGFKRK